MLKKAFPAPETWDKLPPESNRQRIIGNLCMAGVLASANTLGIGAILAGQAQLEKLSDKMRTVTESPATKNCTIDRVAFNPGQFVLGITAEDDPAGTKTRSSWGPLNIERELADEAGLKIEQQQGHSKGGGVFEFDAASFPQGSSAYDVSITHDSNIAEGIGPLEVTRHETLQEPCGSITLTIRDGSIEQISAL